jgi:hypothetical protein
VNEPQTCLSANGQYSPACVVDDHSLSYTGWKRMGNDREPNAYAAGSMERKILQGKRFIVKLDVGME